jgi:hypothetical protein
VLDGLLGEAEGAFMRVLERTTLADVASALKKCATRRA